MSGVFLRKLEVSRSELARILRRLGRGNGGRPLALVVGDAVNALGVVSFVLLVRKALASSCSHLRKPRWSLILASLVAG